MSEKLMREILGNQVEIMRGVALLLTSGSHAEPNVARASLMAFTAGRIDQAMTFTLEMLNRKQS